MVPTLENRKQLSEAPLLTDQDSSCHRGHSVPPLPPVHALALRPAEVVQETCHVWVFPVQASPLGPVGPSVPCVPWMPWVQARWLSTLEQLHLQQTLVSITTTTQLLHSSTRPGPGPGPTLDPIRRVKPEEQTRPEQPGPADRGWLIGLRCLKSSQAAQNPETFKPVSAEALKLS